ncbi:MAG TPA: HAMP domain-containing sensor histidine kinase [Candidatus Eisenbacteria bacterium]|nr:HAMP domain-containing sensor histidine kinase [Candidatus Eisenbacteria bacterium]
MRLAAKIFAASLLPLFMLIEVAGWSLSAVNRVVQTNRRIVSETLPALRQTAATTESMTALVRLHTRWSLLHDPGYQSLWTARADDLERELATLADSLTTATERQMLRKCRHIFGRYRDLVSVTEDGVTRLRTLGPPDLRVARLAGERMLRSIRLLGLAIDHTAQQAQTRAAMLEQRTWTTVFVALPLTALLALVLSITVAVRVTRVLRRLATASTQLAQGQLSEPVVVNRNDELGDLGRAFNAMAARLGETDRLKEQVFSHVSHELRTPLTSMREATHLLADRVAGPLTPRQERLVAIVGDSTDRLLRLVNRILDLSRLRAGLQPLERRPVRLADVAARALHELRPQAEATQVRMIHTGNGADPWVLGDEERLVEVVVNLVSNAIKASPAGAAVRVGVHEEGGRASLVVEDSGVGVPADVRARIFDPYVQGPGAPAGTGLGLAIVKSIVEAHRGEVHVESDEGRGSRFALTLPRVEAPS